MSSALKNLSEYAKGKIDIQAIQKKRFAIVVAEWNTEVTEALYNGAVKTLQEYGVPDNHIFRHDVPGSFELTLGAQWAAKQSHIDAVICLGCVIQGETRHFDFICMAVAQGITNVNLQYNKPVIFGVLTPDNQQQAIDRAGGKHGNKGDEAASTAVKMLALHNEISSEIPY